MVTVKYAEVDKLEIVLYISSAAKQMALNMDLLKHYTSKSFYIIYITILKYLKIHKIFT